MNRFVAALNSPNARAAATAVAFLALILAGYVEIANIGTTRCLVAFNQAASQATKARSAAYDQTVQADRINTEAEDTLWETVYANQKLPPAEQKAAGQKAFELFLAQRGKARKLRADAAAERAQHPLPAPPSQRCG